LSSVRALSQTGDWTFGRGRANYLTRNSAIAQNISTRLKSFLGDCFFSSASGIDWFNLLGSSARTELELAIATTILNTDGVTGLERLDIEVNADRFFRVSYAVTTVYTGLPASLDALRANTNFLLTEDGSIITTEDGDPLSA
jgi:hypothetical protein